MDEVVINLLPDGTIYTLYNELVDWQDLGHCEIERASFVEFNNDIQRWEVILPNGNKIGNFKTRGEALNYERKSLQEQL